jgi:hypothetical protein
MELSVQLRRNFTPPWDLLIRGFSMWLVLVLGQSALADESARVASEFVDLTRAVVMTPPSMSLTEKKAVSLLVEDVARRAGIHWHTTKTWPAEKMAVLAVGQASAVAPLVANRISKGLEESHSLKPEGYLIRTESGGPTVLVAGNDPRGVLFGVGRLLRELRTSQGRVLLPSVFQIVTSPHYALRGHQLGYRPKTNSYDGWNLAQWEQYICDLAIFGTNAVELIPPRSDDDADSPHFPLPPLDMMVGMSRLLDEYGLDVWIWYPAMDRDYADSATVAAALKEWDGVFQKLPRVDAVFVPGGDPGHTPPKVLMPFLAQVTEVLHRSHPKATMWVSPQGFTQEWLDQFLEILKQEPSWLTGVVHGPQIRIGIAELRRKVPKRYPIRTYPDITHSQQCQFPIPDWDLAFSLTEGREVINPRPVGEATIFRYYQPGSIGFITYSEGCNDDVNKFVWSGLGWDPDAKVEDLLRQYGRAFLGDESLIERFAEGLLSLERNWRGPLRTNEAVAKTLSLFQELEQGANPAIKSNWRFQQALYRAYYDDYVRNSLIQETQHQETVLEVLRQAKQKGSINFLREAIRELDHPPMTPQLKPIRRRVFDLAEELFVSIRMQLSVPLYDAIAVDRGANLDTIDVPLNDRLWLRGQLSVLTKLEKEEDRQQGINAILHRTDPGPGGFYDDLGNLEHQPHLVRGPGFELDPDMRRSSIVGFGSRAGWPLAWCQNAQTLYDAPLEMRYDQLVPEARYKVRVVYAGDSFRNRIRLDSGDHEVHGWLKKPNPPTPLEFDVPQQATSDGKLTLIWRQEPGKGGNGRGCQVAEVWLIRK